MVGTERLFEALARAMPFAAVARLAGESWHRVHAILASGCVALALAEADLSQLRALAIDETSYRRAHIYLTAAADAAQPSGAVRGRRPQRKDGPRTGCASARPQRHAGSKIDSVSIDMSPADREERWPSRCPTPVSPRIKSGAGSSTRATSWPMPRRRSMPCAGWSTRPTPACGGCAGARGGTAGGCRPTAAPRPGGQAQRPRLRSPPHHAYRDLPDRRQARLQSQQPACRLTHSKFKRAKRKNSPALRDA